MKKKAQRWLVHGLLCWMLGSVNPVYAQPMESTELLAQAQMHDGKTVVYAGEIVGEIMRRGDFAWVNIHDGENAIGVWVPQALLKDIVYAGSYKARGDGVEVSGVFRRACPEHGGDLDIHARVLRKIGSGRVCVEKLNIDKKNFAVILLGIMIVLWILSLFIRK